jgi:signal transduction histidine kinase
LPVVMADRIRMQRVWVNLLSNAIKYVQPGEIPVVTVGSTGRRTQGAREEWALYVRDNGIGIAPEYHQQIFEVFRRLHTHEQYEGTGAGLAIVKRVVEFHWGRVWVESQEGQGSTFWFTLPHVPAMDQREARRDENSSPTAE